MNHNAEKNESSYNKSEDNLQKVIETEFLERVKIKQIKDVIVEEIKEQKNNYLENLDKKHIDMMGKINRNDELLDQALKSGNTDDIKKAFQKILDDSKKE